MKIAIIQYNAGNVQSVLYALQRLGINAVVTDDPEEITGADKVIFTKVDSVRTADPEELAARYIELYGKMAQVAETLEEALEIANRAVTKEDLICITGSFYLVGEAKKVFAKMARQEAAEAAAAAGSA